MTAVFVSRSEEETRAYARRLAESLALPAHVLLIGDLGAGKTAFTKGLAAGFGLANAEEVSSPTFTLVNQYPGRIPIYHLDLYRLESHELADLGLEEIFDDTGAAVVVEWAERLGAWTPPGALRVRLTYLDPTTRRIEIEASG